MAAEPTFAEKSVLFILMAEAREIPNALITNRYRAELKKAGREKLRGLGLVNVRTDRSRLYLELTDLGWKQCVAEFGAAVPARSRPGAAGGALYAMLGAIKRYLDSSNTPHSEFFLPGDNEPESPGPPEVEARIRAAYEALAREPGGWVTFADLRDRLDGLDRAQVDGVLLAMSRIKGVHIVPESNQKALTDRDRRAAVIIGNQHKHLIAIEV